MDRSPTFIACKSETASDICISNISLDGHPNDPTGATKTPRSGHEGICYRAQCQLVLLTRYLSFT